MHKVGISFRSPLSADEVRDQYVKPLRSALKGSGLGIYSNYLRSLTSESVEPTEHLLVFELNDFKAGLRLLRLEWEKLDMPEETQFQNLSPSSPGY